MMKHDNVSLCDCAHVIIFINLCDGCILTCVTLSCILVACVYMFLQTVEDKISRVCVCVCVCV